MTCTKCGSSRVMEKLRLVDRGDYSADAGNVSAAAFRNPDALVFKGTEYFEYYANVCPDCGYAELFMPRAGELYRLLQAGGKADQ